MIVGHYAASFAAKAVRPDIPLWHLILAAQLIDFAWSAFILIGLEQGQIVPGYTKGFPFDFYYMPYSHSLPALALWFLVTLLLYPKLVRKALPGAGMVVGLVVISHWFLDLIVHPEDLGIYPGLKVGFGFWNYPLGSFLLEVGIVIAAFVWYARTVKMRQERRWHYDALIFGSVVGLYAFFFFNLYPESIMLVAGSVLGSYTLVTWLSWWLEKKGVAERSAG